MVFEQHLLPEKLLMDTQKVPEQSYDHNFQLGLVGVEVKILVLVEVVLIFYPILKLVKLAQFGILSRND